MTNINIEKFVCERLSIDNKNKKLMRSFTNSRNPNIAEYLKKCAWIEDKNGQNAHYIIKDTENDKIVLYFSLKCGSIIKKFSNKEIGANSKKGNFKKNAPIDTSHMRVGSTRSGIELTHICINDSYVRGIEHYKGGLGLLLFYVYIVPLIKEIYTVIGCEYLYLFVADNSEDRSLVAYYKAEFKFKELDSSFSQKGHLPILTAYNQDCTFMYLKINSLI